MVFLQRPPPRKPPTSPPSENHGVEQSPQRSAMESAMALLADAGCTLSTPAGPPSLSSDPNHLRRLLEHRFSADPSLVPFFIAGFSAYVRTPHNLRRVLTAERGSESLIRTLLLVGPVQLQLQRLLLEKLPEFFHVEVDVCNRILSHFRWLDFLVDAKALLEKMLELLSICPSQIKKEIVGSFPEIFGDWSDESLVSSLHQLLQEDSDLVLPVLDAFSNFDLSEELQEQVVGIALSCMRTIDMEYLPFLVRFVLLSANAGNARRIVYQIRENLFFIFSQSDSVQRKMKGKYVSGANEVSILEALSSIVLFKDMLCDAVIKEIKCLDKPQDHKVIDLWLLILLYSKGNFCKKSIELIIKKKLLTNCFTEELLRKCIQGQKSLPKDYLFSFLLLCQFLFGCKEPRAREFGIFMYVLLFKEFADAYLRQEVLGALVMHIGSGIRFEVDSAINAMVQLTSELPNELFPLCPYINGVLDYLEGLTDSNLSKVYEVFTLLAWSASLTSNSNGSSVVNELLMIIRKQVVRISNLDLKYKKMGIIGILKLVSIFGDSRSSLLSPSQKTIIKEAMDLLKLSLDSYKFQPLSLILLYDEIVILLEQGTLQLAILEWMSKQVGEFESKFVSELDSGLLVTEDTYGGLEGELWMNLDGELAPICLNILPLLCSPQQMSSSLQTLPSNFQLLAMVERLTNQGSLEGIDALLGCPLYLPSSKYFTSSMWASLTSKQKELVCLSLFYAVNWLRELLNAFCTQVCGEVHCLTQDTRQHTIAKLLKRLGNIVYLENLLNISLQRVSFFLPEVHFNVDYSKFSASGKSSSLEAVDKKGKRRNVSDICSLGKKKKRKQKGIPELIKDASQPSILEVLQRAGASVTVGATEKDSSGFTSLDRASKPCDNATSSKTLFETRSDGKVLDNQRFKFRVLHVKCLFMLSFIEGQDACQSEPIIEFPQYLYLLRDFSFKLNHFVSQYSSPSSTTLTSHLSLRTTAIEFLNQVKELFPSFKRLLSDAMSTLEKGSKVCVENCKSQSSCPASQDAQNLLALRCDAQAICIEVLCCFRKILILPDLYVKRNVSVIADLWKAFQPVRIAGDICSGITPFPSSGSMNYLYCGVYSYLEDLLSVEDSGSLLLAYELLLTLESLVNSVPSLFAKLAEDNEVVFPGFVPKSILLFLQRRLGMCAQKLLMHDWNADSNQNDWKKKVRDVYVKILQIYIRNNDCPSEILLELAALILTQASSSNLGETKVAAVQCFPTFCPTMSITWYRVLHQENLSILKNLIKEFDLANSKFGIQPEIINEMLIKMQQSVDVVVALVDICRGNEKVTMHAVAVEYGGKYVDSFLKVFKHLHSHFNGHSESIIQMVKYLQKATRTIQTLCSEAKGSKRAMITSKIPASKRSMERFIFCVKALLHKSCSGSTFWLGNLKHKDLYGQVVNSQVYIDGDESDQESLDNNVEE